MQTFNLVLQEKERLEQCAEIFDYGQAGMLVNPGSPDKLADALVALLGSPARRAALGNQLKRRVEGAYGPKRIVEQVGRIYETALRSAHGRC